MGRVRRVRRTLSIAPLLAALLAAPAGASDHLMKVNEILPQGELGAQFVELLDPVGEPFPSPPYKLIVYSQTGALLGKVTLPEAELTATGTSPYLVANNAYAGARDEQLTVSLPIDGQVCFTRGAAETRIHCVAWGCDATSVLPSEGGSILARTNVSGNWSLQLDSRGTYGAGPPTPDFPNQSLAPVVCEPPAPPVVPPDRTSPAITLGGKRRQRLSRLSVTVTVDERSTVVATGSVKVGRRRRALRKVRRVVPARTKVVLRLKLPRRARSAVRAALARGRSATAAVKVEATDASGNSTTKKRTIKIRP